MGSSSSGNHRDEYVVQVIDGSLNFFQDPNPFLEFTPGSDGNRAAWTIGYRQVDPNTTGTYNPFTLTLVIIILGSMRDYTIW